MTKKSATRLFGMADRWAAVIPLVMITVLLTALGSAADAAVKKEEFPVAATGDDQLAPGIGGNIVVWEDDRDASSNIYGKDLATGREFLVATGVSVKRKPVTNGNVVVWEDDRGSNSDVYGYRIPADLSTAGEEFLIASGPGDQRKPAISGNVVVWEDNRSGKWEIYSYDLTSAQKSPVATGEGNKTNPAVSGETVVWQDGRDGVGTSGIYAKNLATGEVFQVSTGPSFADTPAISGGIVVWRQESEGNYDIFGRDIYAKDLATRGTFQVTTDPNDQTAPAISDGIVVWEDHRDGNANVYGKDLSTGQKFQVTSNSAPEGTPEINGETVVWETQRVDGSNYGTWDIYGARLDSAPEAPGGLKATGSLGGIALRWNASEEGDLAGYNVYRSAAPDGTYTRLNASLIADASYSDKDAPKGSASYYRVTAVDAVGNESAPATVSSAALMSSDIGLNARPARLEFGKTTTLSGKLTAGGSPLSDRPVVLEQRPAGTGKWVLVPGGRLTTAPDGDFSLAGIKPKKNTAYRARFAGDPRSGFQASTSQTERVFVKPKVRLADPRFSEKPKLRIRGKILTAKVGKIKVVIRRNGKTIARKTVRLNDSRFWLTYRLPGPGKYAVRAIFLKNRIHLSNRSPLKTLRLAR